MSNTISKAERREAVMQGLCDGFKGDLDTYMCYCPCHEPKADDE